MMVRGTKNFQISLFFVALLLFSINFVVAEDFACGDSDVGVNFPNGKNYWVKGMFGDADLNPVSEEFYCNHGCNEGECRAGNEGLDFEGLSYTSTSTTVDVVEQGQEDSRYDSCSGCMAEIDGESRCVAIDFVVGTEYCDLDGNMYQQLAADAQCFTHNQCANNALCLGRGDNKKCADPNILQRILQALGFY
jgi:hypothetical protein